MYARLSGEPFHLKEREQRGSLEFVRLSDPQGAADHHGAIGGWMVLDEQPYRIAMFGRDKGDFIAIVIRVGGTMPLRGQLDDVTNLWSHVMGVQTVMAPVIDPAIPSTF